MTKEHTRITMRAVTGILVMLGFMAATLYIIVSQPQFDKDTAILVGALVGYLSAKADTVTGWYFGSSEGQEVAAKANNTGQTDDSKTIQ